MTSVAVVMPAWNESEGIRSFLVEIAEAMDGLTLTFVVVDDCSTDDTGSAAASLDIPAVEVKVDRNLVNRGHGPSTVTALWLGLNLCTDIVVAVDGDGQFTGADMRLLVDVLVTGEFDVVEGLRRERGNPLYRRVASLGTRALVATKAHSWPTDANTPLRAYRNDVLSGLLSCVPADSITPNLVISAATRRWKLRVAEVPVVVRDRLGESAVGTTWGARAASIPTSRFVKFCWNGIVGWSRVNIPSRYS
jgi:dolichol-phosphate mannosyltransferase